MAIREGETPGRGTGPGGPKRGGGLFTRRALLRRLGMGTAAAVGLSYVRPSLLTVAVSKAYANGVYAPPPPPPPPPPLGAGLTPGYWKNWGKGKKPKYTAEQFQALLGGTFVSSFPVADRIPVADDIFDKYRAKPGDEMTKVRAFLLAVQLTIALISSGLPVPAGVYLSPSSPLPSGGTLGDAIADALSLEAEYPYSTQGVSNGDRNSALDTKGRLEELLTL